MVIINGRIIETPVGDWETRGIAQPSSDTDTVTLSDISLADPLSIIYYLPIIWKLLYFYNL